MAGDRMEVIDIEVKRIRPNTYNPNIVPDDILAKLGAEIAHKGVCVPIVVRKKGDGYEIVDGFHRWRICRDLGWEEIPCIIQDYDDNEAKMKTIQLNYMKGEAVPVKLASLIHELSKEIKLEDLAKRLPYEEPQLIDNLELLKLPDDFGKEIEERAMAEEQEMPSVMTFVVEKEGAELVEEAIKKVVERLPEGTKNMRAIAIEKICSYFLSGQYVNEIFEGCGAVE